MMSVAFFLKRTKNIYFQNHVTALCDFRADGEGAATYIFSKQSRS